MRLQRFTDYLLKHRWKAMLLTFVITFIPVIGIVGILIAALMTLLVGVAEGAIYTAIATLPFVISFCVSGSNDSSTNIVMWAAVGVAVSSNILTWVFAVMLRKQTSWSTILQIATLSGVLVVSVIHLVYPGVVDWWGNELQSYYTQAAALTTKVVNASSTAATQAVAPVSTPATHAVAQNDAQLDSISLTKQYATGLMVAAILFNAIMQLVVARWWQVILYAPGTLRKELHRIRLSQLAGVLFTASLVLAYMGNSVVLDIMPILYLLFITAGLSLTHYLFGLMNASSRWFWLALMYITVLVSLPVSALVISFLALLDVWLDVRKRISDLR